ncbi:MAG: SDR family NAD(P)-dependent oxidoreductase [Myxococcales bacterium]|nr:SDR family NAD(P)-dependent oxidoreductase [Myxococcales bacterium]
MNGRVALVTGATAGFGWETTKLLIERGYRVVGTGRRQERLEALADELGDSFLPVQLDMQDSAAISALPETIEAPFWPIDVLVNNAGLALGLEPAWEARLDEWDAMLDTNVRGLMHLTRAILPSMVARGTGHIVNMSSIAANWPYPGGNVYGGTKAFVSQFSRNLRADLLGKGVRVTSIEPGLCKTEFSVVRFRGDAESAEKPYEGVEPISARDIAETVLWVIDRPAHVNINQVELMATNQAFGPLAIHREK